MTARAFAAIVETRLFAGRRVTIAACAAAALVGVLQPRGIEAPLFFCSFAGIAMAMVQSPGRYAHLDLCEQSAPLFGRELARAKALVPCLVATLATLCYGVGALAGGASWGAAPRLSMALAATLAATLTALSASVRRGSARSLYVLLSAAVACAAYALATIGAAAEAAFCASAAFVALRQYGETLARYDPV
ncbi:MAG TPA: hypothetical protein VMF61_15015 [Candidatus Acidoferrales bacterium]|nr:hypothetical protein [Candidatus Acidoferrales bacterium]